MTDRRLSRRSVLASLGTAAAAGAAGAATGNDRSGGCPGTDPLASPAPGPDVLYEDPAVAPQFESDSDWSADPLLVCGQTAHDDGEFLYQGWPFDDHGAATDDPSVAEQPVSGTNGDLVYPTDTDRYANNGADILELRARPTADGVAYRIALNTMVDPGAAVVAIAIDTGDGDRTDWGHGLGDLGAPVDHVLTVAGDDAALDGTALDTATVDVDRNRITVEVPLEPDGETWTHYAVAGVHDGDLGFAPVQAEPDERNPGGTSQDVPPVFDVGFRTEDHEPTPSGSEWRDEAQAAALADRDISEFGADVDFGALQEGVTRRSLPQHGYFNRLYASRFDLGAGIDVGADNRTTDPGVGTDDPEDSLASDDPRTILRSRVQPYSVYVPESYDPDGEPASLFVLPHSLSNNYNEYSGTPNLLEQLGEQRDAIVLVLGGRGPSGWWKNEAQLDLFEAWADLRARYDIDPDRVDMGGYSMGGHGTYKLASQYPDLFGRAFSIVGPADEDLDGAPTDGESERASRYSENGHNAMRISDNLRHIPLLIWAGTNDELVPYPGMRNYRRRLADHGYRHRLDSFPGFDHFAHMALDEWGPAQAFLEGSSVTREPQRVTYRTIPEFDNERFGFVHDGAYWVQDIEVADGTDEALVDATSLTDGYGESVAEEFETAAAEPAPNTREGVRWQSAPSARPPENAIELALDGVGSVTLYVDEANVDTTEPLTLRLDSTHEAELTLKSGAGEETVAVPVGESTETVTLCGRGPGGTSETATTEAD